MQSSTPLWDYTIQHAMDTAGIICRYVSTPTRYAPGRHRHPGIGIVYCVKGSGVFTLGDQILPYSEGTLVYFDSEVPHQVRMETPYDRWDVCIRPETAARLLRSELFQDTARQFLPRTFGSRAFYVPHRKGPGSTTCSASSRTRRSTGEKGSTYTSSAS